MNCSMFFMWLNVLILSSVWGLQSSTSQRKYLTIVGTVDGNVHAIDQNFHKVWSTSLGEPMIKSNMSPTKLSKRYLNVMPSLDGSILFQNSRGIRRSPLKSKTAVDLSPSLSKDGLIHVGTKSCKLYCFNLADGSLLLDPQERESKSLKSNIVDATSVEYDHTIPFWLGRLDYKINGMDPASGEDEFSVVFSDLEPLRNGNFFGQVVQVNDNIATKDSHNKAVTLSSRELALDGHFIPEQTEIISSPEGFIQFFDVDGSLLNKEPLHLQSPAMHAFMLVIDNGHSAHLVKRLNVRYGLNSMNSLHKLKSIKPRLSLEATVAPDSDNMVLIQASSTENGLQYYFGMDLLNVEQNNILPDLTDDVGEKSSANILSQSGQIPPLKSTLRSPVQTAPKLGRNLKSFRKSEKFLPTVSNISIVSNSQSLSVNQNRKQVNSIIGFHKLSEFDEDLWFDELFHDKKIGNLESRPELQSGSVDLKKAKYYLQENILVIIMLMVIAVLIAIIIILLNPLGSSSLKRLMLQSWDHASNKPSQQNLPRSTSQKDVVPNTTRVGSLLLYNDVIGYGSHGTVVFKGFLNGRAVAVKRMLAQFNHLADREISVLIKSDGHPNVVRYFVKEERNDFVYLGLQLCECSLKDLILTIRTAWTDKILPTEIPDDVRTALLQVAEGLRFLHTNRIVHRDIKPHNILCCRIGEMKRSTEVACLSDLGRYTLKISDMGLSKQLDGENSFSTLSLPASKNHLGGEHKGHFEPVGTIGWQAPEMITRQEETKSEKIDDQSILDGISRKTMAVDVFSLGCVFYFILSMGSHPFGEWYEREANIVNNRHTLESLKHLPDAVHLIQRMLDVNPVKRPTSSELCSHHFFWTASKRLDYLTGLSDKLEQAKSGSAMVLLLQSKASNIYQMRWDKDIDEALLEDSGKYRKYDPYAVSDLLRLIRNKKNHYHELGAPTKALFGSFPDGFCHYFESKFPTLLGICLEVEAGLVSQDSMKLGLNAVDTVEINSQPNAQCPSDGLVSPIDNCILWQDSSLCNTFKCRGWWRDAGEWTDMLTYSSSSKSTNKKSRSIHHARALNDNKYRTKLCSHWELSNGESCPMRKKGKCVFAHGFLELRLRELKTDGKGNALWISSSIS